MYTSLELLDTSTRITILNDKLVEMTLPEQKNAKILELRYIKVAQLEAGFTSEVKYGEPFRYGLWNTEMLDTMSDVTEQMNALISGKAKIEAGEPLGPADIAKALYHHNGATKHDTWTYEEFTELFIEIKTFFLQTRLYCESLEERVMNCTTEEEIALVYYGLPLTDDEMNFNLYLLAEMTGLTVTQGTE